MKNGVRQTLFAMLVLGVGCVGFWLGRDARPAPVQTSDVTSTSQPATSEDDAPTAAVRTRPLVVGTIARSVDAYGTIEVKPGSSTTLSVPFDAVVRRVLVIAGATVTSETDAVEIGPTAEMQLQFKQAQDALAAAQRNLDEVNRRLASQLATNADVTAAEQGKQAADTQLTSLQQRGVGEPRTLKAGAAGVVAQLSVAPGQIVAAGAPLLTIGSNRNFEAIVGFEPADATQLKVGDAVTLRDVHASADAAAVVGTIRLIAPQLNPQSHLREASVALPEGSTLLPGALVTAQAEMGRATGLLVPRSAVIPDDDDEVLFVVEDGKASRRVVKVDLRGRDDLIVTCETLHAGDAIVFSGNTELEDGTAIRIEADDASSTEPVDEHTDQPSTAPAAEVK